VNFSTLIKLHTFGEFPTTASCRSSTTW